MLKTESGWLPRRSKFADYAPWHSFVCPWLSVLNSETAYPVFSNATVQRRETTVYPNFLISPVVSSVEKREREGKERIGWFVRSRFCTTANWKGWMEFRGMIIESVGRDDSFLERGEFSLPLLFYFSLVHLHLVLISNDAQRLSLCIPCISWRERGKLKEWMLLWCVFQIYFQRISRPRQREIYLNGR